MPSIVESWYPANNDTYGVFLEDDVEVSPLFYSWLKFTILYYRYGPLGARAQSERLFGISLYQPKNIELRPEGRRSFDVHSLFEDMALPPTIPYLSQIPCSWGAVYFPEHWREFHDFLGLRLGEVALDLSAYIVPDIRSNRWPRSWKRYIIELVYLRGYTMLYPNYEAFRSLSTNHLELGTHVRDSAAARQRRELFEVPLLQENDTLLEGLQDARLPDWNTLPIIDFWGSVTTEVEIRERGTLTMSDLGLCADPSSVSSAAFFLPPAEEGESEVLSNRASSDSSRSLRYDAYDLLCPRVHTSLSLKLQQAELAGSSLSSFNTKTDKQLSIEEREALLAEREGRVSEREARLAELDEVNLHREVGEPGSIETVVDESQRQGNVGGPIDNDDDIDIDIDNGNEQMRISNAELEEELEREFSIMALQGDLAVQNDEK